jgi:hypothetical protein
LAGKVKIGVFFSKKPNFLALQKNENYVQNTVVIAHLTGNSMQNSRKKNCGPTMSEAETVAEIVGRSNIHENMKFKFNKFYC